MKRGSDKSGHAAKLSAHLIIYGRGISFEKVTLWESIPDVNRPREHREKTIYNEVMMKINSTILMVMLCVMLLLASACQPTSQSEDLQVKVIVALTQTAAALENPPAPAEPSAAETQPPGDYQPLSVEECTGMRDALSQTLGVPGEINSPVPFEDYVNNKTGSGCEITFSITGQDSITTPATTGLTAMGWQENNDYGAAGVGGYVSAYRRGEALCLFTAQVEPVDENACPSGQGYIQCMGDLTPDQLLHSVILNCARP